MHSLTEVDMYARVKNDDSLVREIESSAILSIGNKELQAYKIRKAASQSLQMAVDDINSLKSEMQEIKQLLVRVLKRGEQTR